jgi:hypothetical protein
LIAILDDHSRLIVHAEFFLTESLNDFISCLIPIALEFSGTNYLKIVGHKCR